MVDFDIFVEVTQLAFGEGGDVFGVLFFEGLLRLFLRDGELQSDSLWDLGDCKQ